MTQAVKSFSIYCPRFIIYVIYVYDVCVFVLVLGRTESLIGLELPSRLSLCLPGPRITSIHHHTWLFVFVYQWVL